MNDDLIKRLNRWGADEGLQNHFIGSRSARRDCEEAAAALSEAHATIARLEAENARLQDELSDAVLELQAFYRSLGMPGKYLSERNGLSPREGEG